MLIDRLLSQYKRAGLIDLVGDMKRVSSARE